MLNLSFDFHIHEYFWSFLLKINRIIVFLALGIIFLYRWSMTYPPVYCRPWSSLSLTLYFLIYLTATTKLNKKTWTSMFFWNAVTYFASFCKTSNAITLLCWSNLYCKTFRYNMSAEFSLPHPKQRFS